MKQNLTILAAFSFAAHGSAQDPWTVAPRAYQLRFENEWVRVVEVNYAPKEKIAAHDHTALNAAFVYLNDSGPVVFNHLDLDYSAVTRAPTKTGAFRVYYGLPEKHEVINTSDLPSRFLRVEFKTEERNSPTLKGKFFRDATPAAESGARVQFDHDQVRVSRLSIVPGGALSVAAGEKEPALLIALGDVEPTGAASAATRALMGKTDFIAPGRTLELRNGGSRVSECLRIDFKTPPMSAEALRKVPSAHGHKE